MTRNPVQRFRPDPGTIPTGPGCYLWRDRHGRVIYVGKARSLRARLSSYFGAWSGIPTRTRGMLETADSVEWITVGNEVEALHLEYNLIKRYRPRYNIRYNDDKSYPYLAVRVQDEIPRAMVRRNPRKDGTRYFGPFAHAYAIRETLDLLLRVYPVRTCSQGVYDRAHRTGRPCLLFHIGRCAAPCTGEVDPHEHRALVDGLTAFLDGDTAEALEDLDAQMREEAARLNFESAGRLRDQLAAARKALEKQAMVTARPEDFDAIALHSDDLEAAIQAFFVRRGRVVGRKGWTVDKVEALTTAELLGRFLLDFAMERGEDLPLQILVPELPEDAETLEELLTDARVGIRRSVVGPDGAIVADHAQAALAGGGRQRQAQSGGGRVRIRVPQRGDKRAFLESVRTNAVEAFHQHRLKRAKDFNARSQALTELQEALGLAEAPLRIECYDISTLQGTDTVASMVVMEDGLPRKGEYRRFQIRSLDGQDDFAAMHEVMTRRMKRLLEEETRPVAERRFAYPPNLVVIDGGKGQLAAAMRAIEEVGVEGVEVCSLAKRLEEVFLPGRADPVLLPRGSEALFLLQRVRDEAHRFAITYHRTARGKRMTESAFDGIPGVGPTRRKALLDHFGTLAAVRDATLQQLGEVDGISDVLAAAIHDHLHRPAARASA